MSGVTSRLIARLRRDITQNSIPGLGSSLLGTLGTVLGSALLAVFHTRRVQASPDNMIADTGQVLDAAAANHDHRGLLELVAFAGAVGCDLDAVRQANARDLAQGRVRLLGCHRAHLSANAALLRATLGALFALLFERIERKR